jgi:hypothetical protein
MRVSPSPEPSGPDPFDERTFAQSERETRLTLAAVALVGLQGYVQGLDQELFTHVTRAALRAAALRADACVPEADHRDPRQTVAIEQRVPEPIESDSASRRGTVAP